MYPTMRNNTKGFTVIEILVATSIFAVIMIAALLMYDRSNRVFKSGVEAADVQQNTRIAFDKIVADLRMAGFDFDRDGTPSLENAYQQPDEQIEYISEAAITVRANFDYNDDPVNTDHGREFLVGDTPGDSGLESEHFPVVTTGNDEIATYALVSADATKNTDSISFFADVPDRASHPESGGRSENPVTIGGVDLSNLNPPYTLQRITLRPGSQNTFDRIPIATNIRSLTFEYFEDQVGTDPLTDLTGAVIAPADYATEVGGLGQFDPDATTVEVERQLRAKIQSIKLVLVGMTENPDPTYTDPDDSVAPRHRKYRLESLVVPRNYGRRGFKEQDYTEPNAPVITQVCIGYCGVAYVRWEQPATGGAPEDYQIRVDTDPTGSYPIREAVGLKTFDFVKLPDPSQEYFFVVAAINSYGAAASARYPAGATGLSANNNTKPGPAVDPLATPQTNQILLEWTVPSELTDLDATSAQPSCSAGTVPNDLPIEEFEGGGFRIARSLTSGFVPAASDVIFDPETSTGDGVTIDPITFGARYTDRSTVSKMGPAACYNYYYRLRTQEACFTAADNNGGDVEKARSSDWTTEVAGMFTSDVQPAPPATLEVVEADSVCNTLPAPDGYCHVKLKWDKVKKDVTSTTDQFITIGDYLVYRDTYHLDGTLQTSTVIPVTLDMWEAFKADPLVDHQTDFSDPTHVSFVDTTAPYLENPGMPEQAAVNDPVYNEYRVVAKQCYGQPTESPDSDSSPTVKYPCNFTPAFATPPAMTGTIEGDGTAGSPWLIQPTSELTLVFDTAVASMEASILLPDSSRLPLNEAGSTFPGPMGIFPWDSGLPDGAAYRIDVLVTTTEGCKRTFSYYVESTATNCCLTPVDIETRLLQQDGPGQRTRIRLQNRCSSDLTLLQVIITWDSNNFLSAAGAERLTEVLYPAAASPLGTCPTISQTFANPANTASPITSTPPGGARAVIPTDSSSAGVVCGNTGSDDYEIEVRFNKSYDPLNPPITQVCIVYIRDADPSTQCQIVPGASAAQAVCDTP